jgi:fumarate hydratase class II
MLLGLRFDCLQGLNAHPEFAERFVDVLSKETQTEFKSAKNKFEVISSHDHIADYHGSLNTAATSLFKIANDIRFLGSGPRCGFQELYLPENEAGSSIMPGKVNPTQCEALAMVCVQVLGNNTTVSLANSSGHFQLNTFKPLLAYTTLQSTRLLADASMSFSKNCVDGIKPNLKTLQRNVENAVMTVTALSPRIGYDCMRLNSKSC